MREYLIWWRDNPNKKEIMKSKNIKVMTYEQIKVVYLESK